MKYWLLAAASLLLGPAAYAATDLTGVWMMPTGVHAAGFPMQAGASTWAPVSAGDPRKQHIPTLDEIRARDDIIAAKLIASHGDPNVLTANQPRKPPPFLTEAGRAAFAAFDPKRYEDQDLNCYPFNVLGRVGGGLGSIDLVQNSKQIMIATEINGDNYPRIIYLDGRTDQNALPSWEGYSTGTWTGASLHVTTTKIKGAYFNHNWPLSADAVLEEDYRAVGSGKTRKLEILEKLTDPGNYVEPITKVSYLEWRPDLEMQDFPCEEGKNDQAEITIKPKG